MRRVAPARYDQREAIRSYCAHLRQHAAQAGRPSVGGDELKVEKIRVARQQADKLEMANSIVRGEMLPAAAVAHEWASVLRDVRAGLLAVPSRVSIRLGHLTAHDLSEMDLEIRSVLTELAGVDDA